MKSRCVLFYSKKLLLALLITTVLSMSFVSAPQQADAVLATNNLRIGHSSFDGNIGVFVVSEENQGIDLNGDGDVEDFIPHIYDHSTGITTNLGLAGSVSAVDGNLVAFEVDERMQGNTDLNGDGDTDDFNVLHIYDHSTGTTTNLELSGYVSGVDGNLVAFLVSEHGQGNTDLNNDGGNDPFDGVYDHVLHIYDHSTGITTNLELVAESTSIDGNLVAFLVSEHGQGNTDLNNDGDNGNQYDDYSDDYAFHVYDHSTGVITNLELVSNVPTAAIVNGNLVVFAVNELNNGDQDLDGSNSGSDDVLHVYDHSTGIITNLRLAVSLLFNDSLVDNLVWLEAYENDQVDLNGDGDTEDSVLHIYDLSTGVITNLGLSVAGFNNPVSEDNLIALWVVEYMQGNIDLNGDGDTQDPVLHMYERSTGEITNLGLVGSGLRVDDNLIVLMVDERNHGNTDLNGDGDTEDRVLHVYDYSTGETTNLELATGFTGGFKFSFATHSVNEDLVIFHVHEDDQENTDLNGDGDTEDRVLHVYDHSTGVTANLELTVRASALDGSIVTFSLDENDQGNTDLNGDGDTTDSVLHVYDPSTGVTTNLGLSVTGFHNSVIDVNLIVIFVSESNQGNTDLNNDGDHDDSIAHIYDPSTGEITNLGLDSSYPLFSDNKLLGFLVSEYAQGNTDLNGDGDTEDFVLHLIELTGDELFCGQPLTSYVSVIEGTNDDDVLLGTPNNDLIFGMDGNDLIFASHGDDCVFGGNGNDSIFGRGGNDMIFGEDGDDTLFGAMGNDVILGGAGNDHLMDDFGNDTLDGGEDSDLCYDKYGNNDLLECEIKNE